MPQKTCQSATPPALWCGIPQKCTRSPSRLGGCDGVQEFHCGCLVGILHFVALYNFFLTAMLRSTNYAFTPNIKPNITYITLIMLQYLACVRDPSNILVKQAYEVQYMMEIYITYSSFKSQQRYWFNFFILFIFFMLE